MKRVAISINLIIVALLVAGCGPSTRERVLHTTFVSLNAAADGFVLYDRVQQHAINQLAMSLQEGRDKLADYRARRHVVMQAFQAAYRALAAATIVSDDPKSFASAVNAAAILKSALEQFRKDNDQ